MTSVFLHSDILHLAFNLYWLWVLGTAIEGVFGHFRMLLLVLLFAIGSGSWDFAIAQREVGLSGVGYGLFGLLYVLSRGDERLRGSLGGRIIALFVSWFVLCVVITLTHVWRVANIAYAAGAVLGLLVGCATVLPSHRRLVGSGVAVLTLLGLLWGHSGAALRQPFQPGRV